MPAERCVHELLNRPHTAVARRQLQHAAATRLDLPADLPVRADIGAAETIDRLLRIADDEELSRNGTDGAGIADARIVGGEEQQDVRLNRIGILELVDEDAAEFCLQMAPDGFVRRDQIACVREEIDEVERARGRLQLPVTRGGSGQFLLQTDCKVGVGVLLELLQFGEERVACGQHVASIRVLPELVTTAFACARQAAIAHEIDETRLPAVVIRLAERRLQLDLTAEPADGVGVDEQVVALGDRRRRKRRQSMKQIERTADRRDAIEWRPPPRMRKLAPLGERAAGLAQPIDRTVAVAAAKSGRARPPQRAPESLRRPGERLLQPALKRPRIKMIGLRLGQDGEQRIDAGLDRPFTNELGAEAMNRVDVRFFEALERFVETILDLRLGASVRV